MKQKQHNQPENKQGNEKEKNSESSKRPWKKPTLTPITIGQLSDKEREAIKDLLEKRDYQK